MTEIKTDDDIYALVGKRMKLVSEITVSGVVLKVGTQVLLLGFWFREGLMIARVREVDTKKEIFSVMLDQMEVAE